MHEFRDRFRMSGESKELTKDIVDERVPPTYEQESDEFMNPTCEVGELTRRGDWVPPVYTAEFEGSIHEPDSVLWEIDDGSYFAQLWLSEVTSDGRIAVSWFFGGA